MPQPTRLCLPLLHALVLATLGCGGSSDAPPTAADPLAAAPAGQARPASPRGAMTLLQANVGNVDLGCRGYVYKLCDADVEDRVAAAIARLAPDVIALQEVTAAWQCLQMDEDDPDKVCHPSRLAVSPHQARRLVGAGYTIACASRNAYECVAVKTSFASVDGCAPGHTCIASLRTAPMAEGCDDGFTVSALTIRPHGAAPFTLVDAHPPSGPFAGQCRADQFRRIFEGWGSERALATGPTLVSGDFNFDPYHDKGPDVSTWARFVGGSARMRYHSGVAERSPPYDTSFGFVAKVFDHVASDFASGACRTLGEAPGTSRLDGGRGNDHRALLCELRIP